MKCSKFMVRYDEAESYFGPGSKFRSFSDENEARQFLLDIKTGKAYYKVHADLYELKEEINARPI